MSEVLAGIVGFSCVHPRSQFFKVPMLTPSLAANAPLERLVFIRYFVSNSANELVLFWPACESTFKALITRWQKGFRNHPFRQILSYRFSPHAVSFATQSSHSLNTISVHNARA
jgi:hypothetical protein